MYRCAKRTKDDLCFMQVCSEGDRVAIGERGGAIHLNLKPKIEEIKKGRFTKKAIKLVEYARDISQYTWCVIPYNLLYWMFLMSVDDNIAKDSATKLAETTSLLLKLKGLNGSFNADQIPLQKSAISIVENPQNAFNTRTKRAFNRINAAITLYCFAAASREGYDTQEGTAKLVYEMGQDIPHHYCNDGKVSLPGYQ